MTTKKKITFVRHAKSSWTDPKLSDVLRPLNARGVRDRASMSLRFKSDFFIPELLISSHAKRAIDTATSFAKSFGFKVSQIVVDKKLYHADIDDYEDVIIQQSNEFNSLMLFSHNPGLTYMANEYSIDPINNVPTTGIFILESDVLNWNDFLTNCKMTAFIYPKMYA